MTCWVVALKAEASVIISHFQMSKISQGVVFPIFKNRYNTHFLVISGIGQTRCAAATIYLHEKILAPRWSGWINIGIAGFCKSTFGSLIMIDKVTSLDTSEVHYPSIRKDKNVPLANLLTSGQANTKYNNKEVFDMEGFSFFEIASRLVSKELIVILKIVSDDPSNNIKKITKKSTVSLFKSNLAKIIKIAQSLEEISKSEATRLETPKEYKLICARWHFSVTQKNQLKYLVNAMLAISPDQSFFDEISVLNNSKAVLKYLKIKVDQHEINWSKF